MFEELRDQIIDLSVLIFFIAMETMTIDEKLLTKYVIDLRSSVISDDNEVFSLV